MNAIEIGQLKDAFILMKEDLNREVENIQSYLKMNSASIL